LQSSKTVKHYIPYTRGSRAHISARYTWRYLCDWSDHLWHPHYVR